MLISQIKVRRKKLNQGPTPLRLDLTSIDKEYITQISNRFEYLLRYEESETPNEIWKEGKRNVQNIAKRAIAKKKKSQKQWITNETLLEIKKRRISKARGLNTDEKRKMYRENTSKIQKMIRQDQVKYINEQCEAVEQNSITNTTKDLYRRVKNLTRKFRSTVDAIKDENGKILNDGQDIRNRWKSFCEDLCRRNDHISSELPNTSYENVELLS